MRPPDHPIRVGFALGFAVLLLLWTTGIDQLPFRSTGSTDFYVLGERLLDLVALSLAAVPLVALRWAVVAAGLGLAPLLLSVVADTTVPITVYVSLVLGGAIAWQRSRPGGLLLAGLGVAVCVPVMLVPWSGLGVYGTISVDWTYDSSGHVELAAYAVAAALVLGLAEAARRTAERTTALTVREGAVTRDADGKMIAGSMSDASHTDDLWTFRRTIGSNDPNWLLDEIEAA